MTTFGAKIFLLASLWACASYITVQGQVAVRGNEPFAYLSIVDEDAEYEVHGELAEELRQNFQGQTVTVTGKVTESSFGPLRLEIFAIIAVE